VDIVNISSAVAMSSHRKQKRGAQKIGNLEAGVVLAVPERRHLKEPRITIPSRLELLRKNGMRDCRVWGGRSTVGDHQPPVSGALQKILKILTDGLHGKRVDGPIIAVASYLLDPCPTKNLGIVVLQEIHERIKEADRLAAVASSCPSPKRPPYICALDLRQDASQSMFAVVNQTRIEPGLELDELACQTLQESLIYHDSRNNQHGGDTPVWRSGGQVARIARLIYVAEPQDKPLQSNYGRPRAAVGSVA
jgi:hypothetical protein